MKKIIKSIASLLIVFNANFVQAQFGQLDSSFNGTGIFNSMENGNGNAIEVQPDNKILIGGNGWTSSAFLKVARLNHDGSYDSTFGVNGVASMDPSLNTDLIDDIFLLPDGKIAITGLYDYSGAESIITGRILSNGTLDSSFAGVGYTTINVHAGNRATVITAQTDGKLLVGGYTYTPLGSADFLIIRYNTNGMVDSTFGTNGVVLTDMIVGSYDILFDLMQLPDGKIIATGNGAGYFVCMKYNIDGSLDSTFGVNGKAMHTISTFDQVRSFDLQTDGKIVISGSMYSSTESSSNAAIIRLNSDGSLDSTFANNGFFVLNTNPTMNDIFEGLELQSDGKIIAAGIMDISPGDADALIVRLHPDGTYDNTFGINGVVVQPIDGTNYDFIFDMEIDNFGNIDVAGTFNNNLGAARFFGITAAGTFEQNLVITPLIYPNPSNEKLFLDKAGEFDSYKVINMIGEIFVEGEAQETIINVSSLPTGVYKIVFNGKKTGTTSASFIVK